LEIHRNDAVPLPLLKEKMPNAPRVVSHPTPRAKAPRWLRAARAALVATTLAGGAFLSACDSPVSNQKLAPEEGSARALSGTAAVAWVSPTGTTARNAVTFKADATSDIVTIKYFADGTYLLGTSTDRANFFPVTVKFSTVGVRRIYLRGYNSAGTQVAGTYKDIRIADLVQNVPYFFQYSNTINPGGSCQNTSIAMLLNFYGYAITPDDISRRWGTTYAQSPAGLAEVFNSYASAAGLRQRLRARTDGTMALLNSLLNQGKPVIVHGYFTDYGHVLPIVGFDGDSYTVNDPAGKWSQVFKYGGYDEVTQGRYIVYGKEPVRKAINTSDGTTIEPIWLHEVYNAF
jgi:hypothetical protein